MYINTSANISNKAVIFNLKRLTSQIYKLLPDREENTDWQKPLSTIIVEISGMDRVLSDQHEILFPLLCKLNGLSILVRDDDFLLFRRTIFECLNLMSELRKEVEKCQD